MGGNLTLNGISASKIDESFSRKQFREELCALFLELKGRYLSKYKEFPWRNPIDCLSGSTVHFFNENIADSDFWTLKPTMGDIDIQINKDHKGNFIELLNNGNRYYSDFQFIGLSCVTNTIGTLFYSERLGVEFQIDFEAVEFENSRPSEWSQFSYHSDWDDIALLNIKGFAHKYIFRAITSLWLKKAKKSNGTEELVSKWAFSNRGLRSKFDDDGNSIKSSESLYYTDLESIFAIMFGRKMSRLDSERMWSFRGMLSLCVNHFKRHELLTIVHGMIHLLFGPDAQTIVKDDQKEDYLVKMTVIRAMLGFFDLATPDSLTDTVMSYYFEGRGSSR